MKPSSAEPDDRHLAEQHEREQPEQRQRAQRFGGDHQQAARTAVGKQPERDRQQQERQRLHGRKRADLAGTGVQREHGDDRRCREAQLFGRLCGEVRPGEGGEGARQWGGHEDRFETGRHGRVVRRVALAVFGRVDRARFSAACRAPAASGPGTPSTPCQQVVAIGPVEGVHVGLIPARRAVVGAPRVLPGSGNTRASKFGSKKSGNEIRSRPERLTATRCGVELIEPAGHAIEHVADVADERVGQRRRGDPALTRSSLRGRRSRPGAGSSADRSRCVRRHPIAPPRGVGRHG